MRIERSLLDRPLRAGDDDVRRLAIAHLQQTFGAHTETLLGVRVRHVLAESLGARPSVHDVATVLALHPRTLQRRLRDEGHSFEDLRDEVRRDCAHRLITTEAMSFTDVAQEVGFAEQSALSHAVRRWFGTTPRALRATGPGYLSR